MASSQNGNPRSKNLDVKPGSIRIALIGNPNAGKTTLFNILTGLRAKTANFPGTTIELRVGKLTVADRRVELIDMPGLYSLSGASAEEQVALDSLLGLIPGRPKPDGIILLVDATNLERNLYLAQQVLDLQVPLLVALNMSDLAFREGIEIDAPTLAEDLGCPVVPISARTKLGIDELKSRFEKLVANLDSHPRGTVVDSLKDVTLKTEHTRYDWAEKIASHCQRGAPIRNGGLTERIDSVLTHPFFGIVGFFCVMMAMFYAIFTFANLPMDWIDAFFGWLGGRVGSLLPDGRIQSLIVDGIIGGVGGVFVFLPQICILFFFISILDDSGYLARAAFVMDRMMRRVGLPGKAFVPMLSAHACAIPAIMATRVIEDKRDRIVTILTLPLMTCSARLPVYAMVTALLFPTNAFRGAVTFTLAYMLGVFSALAMAFVFKRTILPGETKPLVLEMPSYKRPSLRNALITVFDRARIFTRKAGTVILAISILLWWLVSFPGLPEDQLSAEANQAIERIELEIASFEALGWATEGNHADIEDIKAQEQLSHSFAGRLGHWIEPAVAPLGFDWKIGVGIIASFAAREVIVSALSVIYGVGEGEGDGTSVLVSKMRDARRPDGSAVFTFATCVSLLIFYVLAMQCLPTQVITYRETRQWKWAVFQLAYMSLLAYSAALAAFQLLSYMGYDRVIG